MYFIFPWNCNNFDYSQKRDVFYFVLHCFSDVARAKMFNKFWDESNVCIVFRLKWLVIILSTTMYFSTRASTFYSMAIRTFLCTFLLILLMVNDFELFYYFFNFSNYLWLFQYFFRLFQYFFRLFRYFFRLFLYFLRLFW